jgi:hypothetical protein
MYRTAESQSTVSTMISPLVRTILQFDPLPSVLTRNVMVAVPLGMRPAEMRRYWLSGIFRMIRAGV